jgi:tetratricopeptide (TPR) repeat protein
MLLLDLKIDQAKDLVNEEIRSNPENYYSYYLDQTCDAFKMVINADINDFNAFVAKFQRLRKIMDGKDEESPYYLLCLSEMELHVAVFSVMHGSQVAGVRKGVSAYKDLHRNMERFPGFRPNRKLDGFFNVAIANLPPFVKWALSIMAVKVDIDKGFKTLVDYYQEQKETPGLNAEAALYVILAAKINKTPEMLYDFTARLDTSISATFVHRYFRANIAYWSEKNEEALKILRQVSYGSNKYAEIIYSYMMGKILMRKADPSAELHLKRFLALTRKKEYLKEMNYSLALNSLLKGDAVAYGKYCAIVRSTGMELNERDREALYDARLDYTPDVNLVKARMSLDGGYTDAARKAVAAFESGHAKVPAYELEHHFLKGRYAASTGNPNLAMAEFRKVIEMGEDQDYYFASEAALRLGDLCRKNGQTGLAGEYYKKSIRLYRKDYYEYIEDKASKALKGLPENRR